MRAVLAAAVTAFTVSGACALAPCFTLASGHSIPALGLGTWKSPPGETGAAVKAAVRAGYRFIDAANDYNNEAEVGAALKELIDGGEVTRAELFVQAKLWNTNHRREHVKPDLEQTLRDLQLEYLDSFVIHWAQAAPSTGTKAATVLDGAFPAHFSQNTMFPVDDEGFFCSDDESHYVETWGAMEALVEEKLVRSIGLSNFNRAQIEEVLEHATLPVSLLQVECHPYLQQKDMVDFCRSRGICFQAFSPLGSGDTHVGITASPSGTIPLKDPQVLALAQKYGKDAGQLILKWALSRGISVVTKSKNPARVRSNFELFDWEMAPEDMAAFDTINYGWRHLHWRETSHHKDYPFPEELPSDYKLEKAPLASSSGTAA